MTDFFAQVALLPDGWASNVRFRVTPQGDISSVVPEADPSGAERVPGVVLPGMPNLHSHAFQRAMAGLAEYRSKPDDTFWSWREVMYSFAQRLTPEDLRAIAGQLYVEMLKAGYTAVAEFHYLHHDPDGQPYSDRAEMSRAIVSAACQTGIGLTLLPALYVSGDFGAQPAGVGQRRFLIDVESFAGLLGVLASDLAADPQMRLGMAIHSLRAVPPDAIRASLGRLEQLDPRGPIHIHAAEQRREVEGCLAWSGKRPVEWLLHNLPVDARWCLVHCTHMTKDETERVAQSGAVAGLCPTTEANLGDGLFPLRGYLQAGGCIGIGSDSHVSVSPVEELRWLEYGQRLSAQRRNIAATGEEPHVGARLWRAALRGGARALGRPVGAIAPGYRADIIALDPESPLLAGRAADGLLDSFVFSGNTNPIRHVMVGGRWVVRDARHVAEDEIAAGYRGTIARLA